MKIGTAAWKAYLEEGAASLGIFLRPSELDALGLHAEELLFWNRRTNLTSITAPEAVAEDHFIDAIVPSRRLPPSGALLDIGSGGGFPGIPLRVVHPGLSYTLIDASRKKVTFMNHVIRRIGLSRIRSYHCRAEAMIPPAAPEGGMPPVNRFDVVISRAVGPVDRLVELALPLLARGGIIVSMRGKAPAAASALGSRIGGAEIFDAVDYRLPYTGSARSLWLMRRGRGRE
jgi:16S rRNA (guanine527-N7)-methyltransferase